MLYSLLQLGFHRKEGNQMTTVPTTENLRRIKEAYSSGVLRVQYADRVVWYRSLTEMKEIIFSLEAQLYPKKSSFKTVKIIGKKGL